MSENSLEKFNLKPCMGGARISPEEIVNSETRGELQITCPACGETVLLIWTEQATYHSYLSKNAIFKVPSILPHFLLVRKYQKKVTAAP